MQFLFMDTLEGFIQKGFAFMKKEEYKRVIRKTSLIMTIFILFINSFSIVACAYGATLDFAGWDSISVCIRNVGNGKYISLSSETLSNGLELEMKEATGTNAQHWRVREHVLDSDTTCYSFHVATNENYVIAVEDGNDINGARIVLKYISNINSVPENALFWNFSYMPMQVSFLYSLRSINNGNVRAITSETGTNQITSCDIKSGIDNSIVQCWAFEDISRSIQIDTWDLVDIGKKCDWDCDSKYSSMVTKATNAWNNYIGNIVFRPDAWNVVQDVKIRDLDTDPTGNGVLGRTYANNILDNGVYASSIYFYIDKMEELQSDLQRQKVVMHELGHALGLDENREITSEDRLGNVMQQGQLPYSTYISLDDRASVEQAYADF